MSNRYNPLCYRVPMAHGKLGRSGGVFPEEIFENSDHAKSLLDHFWIIEAVSTIAA